MTRFETQAVININVNPTLLVVSAWDKKGKNAMSRLTLPDGDWIIRVIVREKDKNEVARSIRCRIKDGVIPSEQKTIAYLAKREGYKEGTEYRIKGISAFLEEEAERFPDVME